MPNGNQPDDRWWVRPAVLGALSAVLVVLGAWVLLRSGDDTSASGGGEVATSSSTAEAGTATSVGDGSTTSTQTSDSTETSDGSGAEEVGDDPLPTGAPERFYAIEVATFDLVAVDTSTGDVLENLGGFGQTASDEDVADGVSPQVLQTVETAPDGTLYVDDCCEPAFGNLYIVLPGSTFSPESSNRVGGFHPEVSPTTGRLAYIGEGTVLIIADGDGAELGRITAADFVTVWPLTWIDDATLAVLFGSSELRVYDVSDPTTPVERTEARRTVESRQYLSGATRADGMMVVVGGRLDHGDVWAEVIDPTTGDLIAEFDLPDDVHQVNYDRSGRFLLTVGSEGVVRWYGAGKSGTLGEGYVSVTWR